MHDVCIREEAEARAALAEDPENPQLKASLGTALLRQERYAEGFALLHARWDVPWAFKKPEVELPIPRWSGEDLAGKRFLVFSMEGFGDQIMMARFARLLQQMGAQVDWVTPPELVRLFDRCLGVRVIASGGTVDIAPYDFFSYSGDLPELFFPPLTAPPGEPYLRHPQPSVIPGLTIGVVTHGNPRHANDANRSIPEHLRQALLALPGAVDLKPENTGARDFYDTAQIVAGLDLVISVDTSVAHLAGAMGKPVWILLPARDTDWRWGVGRSDSPWYPTARLFRQGGDERWEPVIAQIEAELLRLRA